jgi:hypothetical protein
MNRWNGLRSTWRARRTWWMPALLALVLVAGCRDSGPASPEVEDSLPDEDQVTQAVEGFYADYISSTTLDSASGGIRNPLLEDYGYREDARFDAKLVEQIDGMVEKAGERGLSADPFLCSVQIPQQADVGDVALDGDSATAEVFTRYQDSAIPFKLTLSLVKGEDGEWKLAEILCK